MTFTEAACILDVELTLLIIVNRMAEDSYKGNHFYDKSKSDTEGIIRRHRSKRRKRRNRMRSHQLPWMRQKVQFEVVQ